MSGSSTARQTLEQKESYATRSEADCCTAAPDVLEFDPAGNLITSLGPDEVKGNGHDWPSSNHGITIDKDGNVWLGGNGAHSLRAGAGQRGADSRRGHGRRSLRRLMRERRRTDSITTASS